MDEQQRRLERQGATGDPEAKAKAIQHELRSGHWEVVPCRLCTTQITTYTTTNVVAASRGCQDCDGYGYVRVRLEDLLPLRRPDAKSPRGRLGELQEALAMNQHAYLHRARHTCCGREVTGREGEPRNHSHAFGVGPHLSYMEDCPCCQVEFGPPGPHRRRCEGRIHGRQCFRESGHHGDHAPDLVTAGRIVPYEVDRQEGPST